MKVFNENFDGRFVEHSSMGFVSGTLVNHYNSAEPEGILALDSDGSLDVYDSLTYNECAFCHERISVEEGTWDLVCTVNNYVCCVCPACEDSRASLVQYGLIRHSRDEQHTTITDIYIKLNGTVSRNASYTIDPEEQRYFNRTGSVIHEYNYIPSKWSFRVHSKDKTAEGSPMFWGIELEVEFPESDDLRKTALEVHTWCTKRAPGHFIIKRDGSLDNGFELVSQPSTYSYIRSTSLWYDLFKFLNDAGADAEEGVWKCGLHTHVTAGIVNTMALSYTVMLLKNMLLPFSRRKLHVDGHWWVFNLHKMLHPSDKYCALNTLKRHGTVEFRFPRGTLNYTTFRTTLQMEKALLDFCHILVPRSARRVLTSLPETQQERFIERNQESSLCKFCNFVQRGGYDLVYKWLKEHGYWRNKCAGIRTTIPIAINVERLQLHILEEVEELVPQSIRG
jgi:hypothetical protein